jgi:hypothetical protein
MAPYSIRKAMGPGTTALLAYLPATDRLFAGFTNSFGYFTEVDYMLDDVIPAVDAGPRHH